MTFAIKTAGADFSKYVGTELPPYVEDALVYYLCGTDASSTLKNRVPGASTDGVAVGSLSYGTGYVGIPVLGGINSQIAGTRNPQTQILVATRAAGAAGGQVICGHWNPSDSGERFDGIYDKETGGVDYGLFVNGITSQTYVGDGLSDGDYNFVAAAYDGLTGTLFVGKSGELYLNSVAYTDPNGGTFAWRIGATGYVATFNVAAAMLFDSKLTNKQILEIYEYFSAIMPGRSITLN
jgi:hypothetical protein